MDQEFITGYGSTGDRLYLEQSLKYVVGSKKGHFEIPEDSIYFDTNFNNNVSRLHANIFYYRPLSNPNINAEQNEEPYWAIEHISQTSEIETVIFTGNFQNKVVLKPGLRYKLPFNNPEKVCGIYLGKITGIKSDGEVIQFGTFGTGGGLPTLDFKLLGAGNNKIFDINVGELNGVYIMNILTPTEQKFFNLLSKQGNEKNPVSVQTILDFALDNTNYGGLNIEEIDKKIKKYKENIKSLKKENKDDPRIEINKRSLDQLSKQLKNLKVYLRQLTHSINDKLTNQVNHNGDNSIKIETKNNYRYLEIK